MRVTLICADDELWASGMRSISSTLRAAGHETTMVFAGSPEVAIDDSVLRRIGSIAEDSEVIGVSSMCRGSRRAKALLAGLRPLGKVTVWGGIHPTLYPEDCVEHADLVCRGEGEGFMLDVVEGIASGRDLRDIPNGAHSSSGQVVQNDLRPLIADLDEMELPDFGFEAEYVLDVSGELVPNGSMRQTNTFLFSGSRGCNNSCTYCSNSQLKSICRSHGRYARKMSVARFVASAEELRRSFPHAEHVYYVDEDFFDRPVEEMRDLAETYPRRVGLPFECMASPRQITEEKAALAARAGAWRIDVGLESGSERVRREVFNRHVGDDVQLRAARALARQKSVTPYYFLIVGNPYEGREDLIDGVRLLNALPAPFRLMIYNLVLIPGTRLFERARQDGIIAGLDDSAFDLDFLAGFDHTKHDWKRQNLYLNGLISLMRGSVTRWRLGHVPRMLLPLLTNGRVVDLGDRHPRLIEALVARANRRLAQRARLPGTVHRALGRARSAVQDRRMTRSTAAGSSAR